MKNNTGWQRPRFTVLMMFFVNGALLASWVSRIPQIQDKLGLSEGQLGLTLLGLSVGVLIALSLTGGLIARYGTRRVTQITAIILCLLLPPLAWMPNAWLLAANLFFFGMAMSSMDVAMNAQAVDVEHLAQRPLMSSFHASWSIGGFAGALLGAFMASQGIDPNTHFVVATALFLVLLLLTMRNLLPHQPTLEAGEQAPVFQLPARVLWGLGVVAFAAAISEGAMADWSALYLTDVVLADEGVAALGFAVYSIMMTLGRLAGDRLAARFSPAGVVRVSGVIASAGLLLAILVPQIPSTLIGFAAVGLGLATSIPLAFSAAGRMPGIAPGTGIAGVATIGYAGFLAGPPVIGLIAEVTSLQLALVLIVLIAATLIYTSKYMRVDTSPSES